MGTDQKSLNIQHDSEASRFSAVFEGETGFLQYSRSGEVLAIDHTAVSDSIGGRGITGQLVRAAFDHARATGLKVRPRCSYAAWLARHPQYADLRVG